MSSSDIKHGSSEIFCFSSPLKNAGRYLSDLKVSDTLGPLGASGKFALHQEKVGSFEVTMQDALAVDVLERLPGSDCVSIPPVTF